MQSDNSNDNASSRKPPGRDDSDSESVPDLRILGDEVSLLPSGVVGSPAGARQRRRKGQGPGDEKDQELMGQMARFRKNPYQFLREVSLFVVGTGWRGYDKVIGQPIFYQGFSEAMKMKVMEHPMLQRIMQEENARWTKHIQEQGWFSGPERNPDYERDHKRWIERNADCYEYMVNEYLDNMICKMESKTFIRSSYYLVTQLLLRAYHQGIYVSSAEIMMLRDVATECAKKKQSIVFLPCHKSHVDYVALQLICYRLGIALPTVVAGDNLNFPMVGSFLQHAGAMWIKRQFDPRNILYTATVQSYIDTLLRGGFNLECFIEGGRSRTGKLLPPKFGILGFIVDSILSKRVDDCLICPVSTHYDKVIETEGYVSELLGVPKKKENLVDFVAGGSSVLSLRLGRVDVRFHQPWSLKGFVEDELVRISKLPQALNLKPNNPTDPGTKLYILRQLGYQVLYDINNVSVIMPTALLGTVLLTTFSTGVGCQELMERVTWLMNKIKAKGGRIAHFNESLDVVVARALEVLGPSLVRHSNGLIEETIFPVDRFQLSFYRNMTMHLFITEALVSVSLFPRSRVQSQLMPTRFSLEQLSQRVEFLSSLFRAEFIFPREGLEANIQQALAQLREDGIIRTLKGPSGGEFDYIEILEGMRPEDLRHLDFYCLLLWPFVESAWLAAIFLFALSPPRGADGNTWLEMSKVQKVNQEVRWCSDMD